MSRGGYEMTSSEGGVCLINGIAQWRLGNLISPREFATSILSQVGLQRLTNFSA